MHYTLRDLLQLMRELRDPEHGCPWDRKQSFETLLPHTIEEVYEVAEAISNADAKGIESELGDLLFQIVFYAQLGDESGRFDFNSIVSVLVEKLLRRHPHVFPDGTLASAGSAKVTPTETEIHQSWERIKQEERSEARFSSFIDDIPAAFPALVRAAKLQKRVAQIGFDWTATGDVLDKLDEELSELKKAIASHDQDAVEDELGDVLFTCVNLGRHLKVEPESALRGATRKFEMRFKKMEAQVADTDKKLADMSVEELESEWRKAKLSIG